MNANQKSNHTPKRKPCVSLVTEDKVRIREGGPCGDIILETTPTEIMKRFSEHEALNRVAEAAAVVEKSLVKLSNWDCLNGEPELRRALTALTAIREEAK